MGLERGLKDYSFEWGHQGKKKGFNSDINKINFSVGLSLSS